MLTRYEPKEEWLGATLYKQAQTAAQRKHKY